MVQYEGEFYPGIIEAIKKKELKVSKNNFRVLKYMLLQYQFFFF